MSQTPASAPTILSVAFPYAPIGPQAVGGAEVICTEVEAALSGMGFQSRVVAHVASSPQGTLYGTPIPSGLVTDAVREQVEAYHQANIDRACREHAVSLVHMHGLDFHRYRIPSHLPVLVTLHLPPSWYPDSIWQLPANYHFMCVSESQRATCPANIRERIAVVPNGTRLPPADTLRPTGRYALMLARICPEKNLHTGLDAARLAGMPAMLGGNVFAYEAHQQYFEQELAPRFSTTGHNHDNRSFPQANTAPARFLGPVSGAEKQRLLSRAACLLIPSLAPETSSLVAMEALAAGVPVVAMAVGALPEIIEEGRTGFLITPGEHTAERMAAAIQQVASLDRAVCRRTAEKRFTLESMLDAYNRHYQELLTIKPALPTIPAQHTSAKSVRHPEQSEGSLYSMEPSHTQDETIAELLTSHTALEVIVPAWTALWASDPRATPFQHPAWLLPWWHQFGPEGQLHTMAVWEMHSRQLLGLLPSYLYPSESQSQDRQLLLIGAGTTDYGDGLWRDSAGSYARIILQHLLTSASPSWHRLYFGQLRRSSPLLADFPPTLTTQPAEPTSFLAIADGLPAKIRVNLNRYRRLAAQKGTLRCELAQDSTQALDFFNDLVHLHSQRWQGRGEAGVLTDPRVLAHHRESLPLLLQAGLLRLFRLTLDGQTLGVLYGLADAPHAADRRLYLYLIGIDMHFAALSPGSLLLHEAWLHARDHGFTTVDLLRGGEHYKHLWGAHTEPTWALAGPNPAPTS